MKPLKALFCFSSINEFNEQGSSLIELALIMPIFVLLLVGAIDFGQAYYVNIEVSSAADAGAAYGLTNPNDTAGMASAAVLDAKDVQGITATASWGCECSDGTAASQNCSTTPICLVNVVNYVDLKTTFTLHSMLAYPGLPSSLALTGHSRMRVGASGAGGVLAQ